MKGYFSDKNAHPWHRVYKDIQTYWKKAYPKKAPSETLVLLRDAIFGALEILSMSIALPNPTSEFLSLFTSEDTWKEGRRKVRNRCIELVEGLIKKKKTRLLVPSALKRDGFGFLVDEIEDVELELLRRAKPKLKKDPKKKKVHFLDLKPLEKCRLGSKFLREQMIMELKIDKKDPRVPLILEAYDHFLVEHEIDRHSGTPEPMQTEQVTLNGTPIPNDFEKSSPSKRVIDKAIHSPLTDFIDEKESKPKKMRKKTTASKKRRTKKK